MTDPIPDPMTASASPGQMARRRQRLREPR
jgi:hypothetical protein